MFPYDPVLCKSVPTYSHMNYLVWSRQGSYGNGHCTMAAFGIWTVLDMGMKATKGSAAA